MPLLVLAQPLLAQEVPVEETAEEAEAIRTGNEIVVIAQRLHAQVDAAEQPIAVYNEEDIAAYGSTSLGDLITAMAPQTGSGRGRGGGMPAILFNGQRISNFREMRGFPPEAIRRMEILPEEVAARFGFPPDQRVINFILKDHFASKSIEAEYHLPTLGSWGENQFQGTLLKIDKASRLNLYLRANDASMLTEAERGVKQQSVNPDQSQFRSLIPDTRDIIFTTNWSTGLGEKGMDGSLAFNGGYTRNDNLSLAGLNTAELTSTGKVTALTRKIGTDTFAGGATLNKHIGSWQMSATLDGSHARTITDIDRNQALSSAQPRDRAVSNVDSATTLITLAGRPLALPAGDLGLTVKAGFAFGHIGSVDTRSLPTDLNRGDLSAGVNLVVPIASRRNEALAGLGDFTLNLGAGIDRISDFGTITDWNTGLVWSPAEKLSLQASYFVNQSAPSLSDLGAPRIDTLNVPVYDFVRGTNALVTVTSGGNPALLREQQRDIKVSANWQVPFLNNSNLLVEWFRNRSENVTSSFPLLTSAIEAAYPGRVTRDANGVLTAIDRRPVTFASTAASRLRWGLNLSGSIGKAQPAGQGGAAGLAGMRPGGFGGPPGGGQPRGAGSAGRGGGPMMAMIGGGNGQGRWNLSVYHTYRLDETVRIGASGPVLNLLSGDALSGGGVSRHAVEFEGGGFYRGIGLRLNGNWAAATTVRASGAPGTSDLRFGSTFKLNLDLFMVMDQQKKLMKSMPFLKGVRMGLDIQNLLESRQRVTDASGQVPLSYQPDLIDPRGRVIQFEFRKMF